MNKYYGELKAFVSFPPLVWTENDRADSDNLPEAPANRQPPAQPKPEPKPQSPQEKNAQEENEANNKATEAGQDYDGVVQAQPAGQDSMKGSPAVQPTSESVPNLKTVVEPQPSSPGAHPEQLDGRPEDLHTRGLRLLNESKPNEAVLVLRRAVELRPDSADYQHNLGVAYAHSDRLDEAVACFREAQRLKPGGTSAFSNMGWSAQQGKTDEAIAAFEECVRIDPKAADIRHRFANVLRSL